MPIVNGRNISPDEAMLLGLCPECGEAITPRTALAHANNHWGGRTRSPEAQRRYDMLCSFADGTDADSKRIPPAAPIPPVPPIPSRRSFKVELNPIDLLVFPFFLEGTGAILRGEITLALLAYFIGCALIYAIHLYGGEISSGLKRLGSNPWGIIAIVCVLLAYVMAPRIAMDLHQVLTTNTLARGPRSPHAATAYVRDFDTGEVVAGTAPKSAQLSAPNSQRQLDSSHVQSFEDYLSKYQTPGANLELIGVGKNGCRIEDDYKDKLASAGWIITNERCDVLPAGLQILTKSAAESPPQASALRRALESAGLKVGWVYLPSLKPEQFILVVGNDNE